MKKAFLIICLFLLAGTAAALAQPGGHMMGQQQDEEWAYPPYGWGSGAGCCMGPGMMPGWGGGPGYGMGSGMIPGWCGGSGYGMGPGMMYGRGGGPGYGMGPGMMYGRGGGSGWEAQNKAYQKFLEQTRDLRKELHMKMFDFMELIRTGAASEKIEKAQDEIERLRKELYKKYQAMFNE